MFSAFFGNYLLKKEYVTAKELNRVLENQKQIKLKLGTLAINSGFMTSKQVNEIHQLQKRYDRRFGDLSIEKGYLTEEILMSLLQQQKSEHLILAQALIDDDIMTMEEFDKAIHEYIKDYELTDSQFEAFKDGNVDVIIQAFSEFESSDDASIYSEFLSLFIKNIIRFIDTNVHLDRLTKIPYMSYRNIFTQEIKGAKNIITAFTGELDALLDIAGKHAEEEFTNLDDYAIDSAGEFLNLSNGLFVVNLDDEGVKLDLTPQQYHPEYELSPKGNLYRVPIYMSNGKIELIIGEL